MNLLKYIPYGIQIETLLQRIPRVYILHDRRNIIVFSKARYMKHSRYKLVLGLLFVLLEGCTNMISPPVHYPPSLPTDIPPPAKINGTIYQPGYDMRIYEDKIAKRVGDVITVRLEESTKGEYKAKTKTDKKAQLNYPMPTLFGQDIPALAVQTNTEQTLDATGDSDQSDKLVGTMTVSVMQVLSNGNLVVQGETWLTINQGQKYIQLTGIIRPADIEPDNVVSSTRIGAAKITYGGRGLAGYATAGGLMTRLFNRFAPF